MNKREILILSSKKETFKFDDGQVKEMTKIEYATKMIPDSDNFVGYSFLTTYVNPEAFNIALKYVGQKVQAIFIERPTKNGAKFVLSKINDVAI